MLLASLAFPRPILFYLARSFVMSSAPPRVARFDENWSLPGVRAFYRLLSIVWAATSIGQLLLMVTLVMTLPTSLMLVLGPIVGFATLVPVIRWSMHTARKKRPLFEMQRQQM